MRQCSLILGSGNGIAFGSPNNCWVFVSIGMRSEQWISKFHIPCENGHHRTQIFEFLGHVVGRLRGLQSVLLSSHLDEEAAKENFPCASRPMSYVSASRTMEALHSGVLDSCWIYTSWPSRTLSILFYPAMCMGKANLNGLYQSAPLPLCSSNRKFQQEIRGRDERGLGQLFSRIPSSRSLAGWLYPLTGWHSSVMWHSPNTAFCLWVFTTVLSSCPRGGPSAGNSCN